MKKLELKEILKNFLFPILAISLIVLLTFVLLIPKVKQILQIKKEIVGQREQITKLSQKLNTLQSLSEPELFDASNLLLEALPAQKDFYKVLALTKKVFNDNSAQLLSFDFAPGKISSNSAGTKEGREIGEMRLKAVFSASYESFNNLLQTLAKVLPLMEIDSVKFSSMNASTSGTLLNLEGALSMRTYFAPLPKTMGSVDAPLPVVSNKDKQLLEELKTYQRYQPEATGNETVPEVVGKENPFP
ncbi:MAG: hypothetical protein ACPLY7_01850 [Microgenomates group bacterium]